MTVLVWLRSDLRIDDNTALHAALAAAREERVGAVFYATPQQWGEHDMAPVRADFLWRNLAALRTALDGLNVPLFVRTVPRFADIADDLAALAAQLQCRAVYANRECALNEVRRDSAVADTLAAAAIDFHCYHDVALLPPGSVLTRGGEPFKVYTPFRRALLELVETAPLGCLAVTRKAVRWRRPARLPACPYPVSRVAPALWPAGEDAAAQRLAQFIAGAIGRYRARRDLPAEQGTSALSPYLALGVISVRRCVEAALAVNGGLWRGGDENVECWLDELLWREFYIHVLAQFPGVSMRRPLRPQGQRVRWRRSAADFARWCEGRTGFPLVDAGMRQLRDTGWMHNRLRMVTAMFLSKYLLLDWRLGERHFMRHLIDGDLAANNGGWQWCASTGTDAVPYFRLLNPLRQAQRFDADGTFCKRFLPELRALPGDLLAQPGHPELLAAGYPPPLVDLRAARERALRAFAAASA